MFKSILFSVFSILCVCSPLSASLASDANSAMREVGSAVATMQKIHQIFLTMAADSTAKENCTIAAGYAAGNITTDCSTLFSTAGALDLSKFSLASGSVKEGCNALVNTTVAAKCSATFNTQYQAAIKVCGYNYTNDLSTALVVAAGGKADVIANMTGLLSLGGAMCTLSDDEKGYCIDGVLASGLTTSLDVSKVNNDFQTTVCKPCTKSLVNRLLASGATSNTQLASLVSALQFVCTVDPTNSTAKCMDSVALLTTFKGKSAKEIAGAISQFTKPQIATLCSPCTTSVINSLDPFMPAADVATLKAALPALKSSCVKDSSNGDDYCAYRLGSVLPAWATSKMTDPNIVNLLGSCATLLTPPFTCSADCANGISNLMASFGCCMGTVTKQDMIDFSKGSPTFAIFATAFEQCTITFPVAKACAGPVATNLPVTFVLDNIQYKWATSTANVDKLSTSLINDIATTLSLAASSVTIKSIGSNGKGGISVLVNLAVDSSVATGYSATIAARIKSGEFSFGQTTVITQADSSSKIDQTKGISAASTSAVGPAAASGAIAATATISTILLTMMALIAFKFH